MTAIVESLDDLTSNESSIQAIPASLPQQVSNPVVADTPSASLMISPPPSPMLEKPSKNDEVIEPSSSPAVVESADLEDYKAPIEEELLTNSEIKESITQEEQAEAVQEHIEVFPPADADVTKAVGQDLVDSSQIVIETTVDVAQTTVESVEVEVQQEDAANDLLMENTVVIEEQRALDQVQEVSMQMESTLVAKETVTEEATIDDVPLVENKVEVDTIASAKVEESSLPIVLPNEMDVKESGHEQDLQASTSNSSILLSAEITSKQSLTKEEMEVDTTSVLLSIEQDMDFIQNTSATQEPEQISQSNSMIIASTDMTPVDLSGPESPAAEPVKSLAVVEDLTLSQELSVSRDFLPTREDGIPEDNKKSEEKPLLNETTLENTVMQPCIKSKLFFQVSVSEPKKVGMEGINAYIVYRVQTKIELPDQPGTSEWTVRRRYRDFLWLFEQLAETHPGIIIPPVPEKSALGRFQQEFVEHRRLALELFLQRVLQHSILSLDPNTKLFLQSEQFQECVDEKRRLKSAGNSTTMWLISTLGEVVSSFSTKFTESDEWLEQQKVKLEEFERELRLLHKSFEGCVKQRKDLAQTIQTLSSDFLACAEANMEEDDSVTEECRLFGELLEGVKEIQDKLRMCDQRNLSDTIDEYIRTCNSIKIAYNSRERCYHIWKQSEKEAQAKRIALEKAKATSSEKISVLLNELRETQHRMVHQQSEFSQATIRLKQELQRWDVERSKEFLHVLTTYTEAVIKGQRELINQWQRYLLQTGGIEPDGEEF